MDTGQAWEDFCMGRACLPSKPPQIAGPPPTPTELYVSTKTKIAYLSESIDLGQSFWRIPITPHYKQEVGVIKKQMKVTHNSPEELQKTLMSLPSDTYVSQHIIEHIDAVEGRIGFRDTRKVSIGVSNKDVSSYRCKKRGAFYNCFSLIIRTQTNGRFNEMHVKVFNTGKLEVPGVQEDETFCKTLDMLCDVLRTNTGHTAVSWLPARTQTVLINSNFATGYLVDRAALFGILTTKYGLQGRYDPCSYPGIQCDFYFTEEEAHPSGKPPPAVESKKDYKRISFMVFRTGSVLIVGKCSEEKLQQIYTRLVGILLDEYSSICTGLPAKKEPRKVKVQRLKTTIVTYV